MAYLAIFSLEADVVDLCGVCAKVIRDEEGQVRYILKFGDLRLVLERAGGVLVEIPLLLDWDVFNGGEVNVFTVHDPANVRKRNERRKGKERIGTKMKRRASIRFQGFGAGAIGSTNQHDGLDGHGASESTGIFVVILGISGRAKKERNTHGI